MFERCCNNRDTIGYEKVHKPKPISFSKEMNEIIKQLLWYVPNIDSFQAEKNELIGSNIYDDFSFTYLLEQIGMNEDKDVKWIEPKKELGEDDWKYYEHELCVNCQKIIIVRMKKLSKTNDLLRCLRNSIAHGEFSIEGDYIIGFNKLVTKNNPEGIKKAIIKIKPKLLLDALRQLTSEIGRISLIEYAFKRLGYRVVTNHRLVCNELSGKNTCVFDLFIEKDGKQYVLEVKDYKDRLYLHPEHIENQLSTYKRFVGEVEIILFIDTSRVTKEVRKLELKLEGIRIIDVNQVKQLLDENPVDILL